jgi:hypothetical protein
MDLGARGDECVAPAMKIGGIVSRTGSILLREEVEHSDADIESNSQSALQKRGKSVKTETLSYTTHDEHPLCTERRRCLLCCALRGGTLSL